jgi:hypothetical protein
MREQEALASRAQESLAMVNDKQQKQKISVEFEVLFKF